MSSPDGPFATLRRAIQVVEHRAAETNSTYGCASTGSNPKPPPLPHLEPIHKILAGMLKRNIKAEKDDDEVMGAPLEQGKTLVLPKDSSAPRDRWRVLLPIIQEKDSCRFFKARRHSELPIPSRFRGETKFATSVSLPALPPRSRTPPSKSCATQVDLVESRAQRRTSGALVIPSHSRQHPKPHIDRYHMESATVPHYHLAAPSGVPHYHLMPLVAHSHPHHQAHLSQRHYRLMHHLPSRPPSTFAVPLSRGPSVVIQNAHSHPHPHAPTVGQVGQSSNGASRALSTEQERKRIEALIQAQNVSGDQEYTPEQLAKMTKRMLNRASVQKCRRKQRERANRLEQERNALIHDNEVLRRVKVYVEQSGIYAIICRVEQAQAAGLDPTAIVVASFN